MKILDELTAVAKEKTQTMAGKLRNTKLFEWEV